MAVFTLPDKIPELRRPVLTIGTFDGVHEGHKAILAQVRQQATAVEGESLVVTFDPHPRSVLFPQQELRILTPLQDKLRLLTDAGIAHIAVVPFTKEFAAMGAEAYVQDFLIKTFRPHAVVIGYDHRFGRERAGSLELLREYGMKMDFDVHEIPAQLIEDAAVSSTKIRKALESGDVPAPNAMLGRPYTVRGTVVMGDKIGRTIGYPTANIQPADAAQLIPGNGVYAVRVRTAQNWQPAMLNIGVRPTVTQEAALRIEAHLLDFDGDLYDTDVEVAFIGRLRDEQRFGSLEELKTQLGRDKEAAALVLG